MEPDGEVATAPFPKTTDTTKDDCFLFTFDTVLRLSVFWPFVLLSVMLTMMSWIRGYCFNQNATALSSSLTDPQCILALLSISNRSTSLTASSLVDHCVSGASNGAQSVRWQNYYSPARITLPACHLAIRAKRERHQWPPSVQRHFG